MDRAGGFLLRMKGRTLLLPRPKIVDADERMMRPEATVRRGGGGKEGSRT
jgi:hypothetical protein